MGFEVVAFVWPSYTPSVDTDPVAKAKWEKDFKLKNDPCINKVGYFLRRTSIDELPQLWNLLKGEMSLVGSLLVVQAELERYDNDAIYYLLARHDRPVAGEWPQRFGLLYPRLP